MTYFQKKFLKLSLLCSSVFILTTHTNDNTTLKLTALSDLIREATHLKQRFEDAPAEIKIELQKEIDQTAAKLTALKLEIEAERNLIVEKNKHIDSLKEARAQQIKELASRNEEKILLQKQTEDLKKEIAEKNAELETTSKEIAGEAKQVEKIQKEINSKEQKTAAIKTTATEIKETAEILKEVSEKITNEKSTFSKKLDQTIAQIKLHPYVTGLSTAGVIALIAAIVYYINNNEKINREENILSFDE